MWCGVVHLLSTFSFLLMVIVFRFQNFFCCQNVSWWTTHLKIINFCRSQNVFSAKRKNQKTNPVGFLLRKLAWCSPLGRTTNSSHQNRTSFDLIFMLPSLTVAKKLLLEFPSFISSSVSEDIIVMTDFTSVLLQCYSLILV